MYLVLQHFLVQSQAPKSPNPPLQSCRGGWGRSTTGILQKKTTWFIGVEVEQETSAPPSKKNPGSVPELYKPRVYNQKFTVGKSLMKKRQRN